MCCVKRARRNCSKKIRTELKASVFCNDVIYGGEDCTVVVLFSLTYWTCKIDLKIESVDFNLGLPHSDSSCMVTNGKTAVTNGENSNVYNNYVETVID
jgi:hypothetical protein